MTTLSSEIQAQNNLPEALDFSLYNTGNVTISEPDYHPTNFIRAWSIGDNPSQRFDDIFKINGRMGHLVEGGTNT